VRLSVFVAALICATSLGAQQVPPPDSARADTSARARVVRDSVKLPLPLADAPASAGKPIRWSGDELFQNMALNVAELIARIPGAMMLRSGYMLAPQTITWFGEPGRVRVFMDGVELDALDRREGLVRDLGAIHLWDLEEVLAEPTPAELRVYLRTRRVTRTAPETRVDVLTGDQETNIYRGFYGRRYQSGLGFQFGFQQFTTQFGRSAGDGDALSLMGRVGFARHNWSGDIFGVRDRRTRNATAREDIPGGIPALTSANALVTLRVAYNSPAGTAPWLQLIASRNGFHEETPAPTTDARFGTFPADTVDTSAVRMQYVATGGISRGGVKLTGLVRYKHFDSVDVFTPAVRALWQGKAVGISASVERNADDSLMRSDAELRLQPFQRLALSLAASARTPFDSAGGRSQLFGRAQAEISVGRWMFSGGAIYRDTVATPAPVVFARGIDVSLLPAEVGGIVEAAGPVYRAIRFSGQSTLWQSERVYRPQAEIRASLGLDTEWRKRFPHGDFTIRAYGIVEHRGALLVPTADTPTLLPAATVFSSNLEIRIKTATIMWQFRNLLGLPYQTIPGYSMPSRINLYGVRWNFFN